MSTMPCCRHRYYPPHQPPPPESHHNVLSSPTCFTTDGFVDHMLADGHGSTCWTLWGRLPVNETQDMFHWAKMIFTWEPIDWQTLCVMSMLANIQTDCLCKMSIQTVTVCPASRGEWGLIFTKCLSWAIVTRKLFFSCSLTSVMSFSQDHCGDNWLCGTVGTHRLSNRVNNEHSNKETCIFITHGFIQESGDYRQHITQPFSHHQTANTVFSQRKPL